MTGTLLLEHYTTYSTDINLESIPSNHRMKLSGGTHNRISQQWCDSTLLYSDFSHPLEKLSSPHVMRGVFADGTCFNDA